MSNYIFAIPILMFVALIVLATKVIKTRLQSFVRDDVTSSTTPVQELRANNSLGQAIPISENANADLFSACIDAVKTRSPYLDKEKLEFLLALAEELEVAEMSNSVHALEIDDNTIYTPNVFVVANAPTQTHSLASYV